MRSLANDPIGFLEDYFGRRACGRSRQHPLLGRLVCFSPPGEEGCTCA